jgi:hypothetical protein
MADPAAALGMSLDDIIKARKSEAKVRGERNAGGGGTHCGEVSAVSPPRRALPATREVPHDVQDAIAWAARRRHPSLPAQAAKPAANGASAGPKKAKRAQKKGGGPAANVAQASARDAQMGAAGRRAGGVAAKRAAKGVGAPAPSAMAVDGGGKKKQLGKKKGGVALHGCEEMRGGGGARARRPTPHTNHASPTTPQRPPHLA